MSARAGRWSIRWLMAVLLFAVAACGGGGGGGPSGPPPFIAATVISFPAGALPPGTVLHGNSAAVVFVIDPDTGNAITNASVSVNGTPLAYSGFDQAYVGELSVAPGAAVALSVGVDGSSYAATGTQFTSYPSITAPASGAQWSSQEPNLVSWSVTSAPANAQIVFEVLDTNGNQVYPPNGEPLLLPPTTTSQTIPSGYLGAGDRLVFVGLGVDLPIANAHPESVLLIAGLNFVQVGVTFGPLRTLNSIAVTPANPTLATGAPVQLTATGSYSDGSTQDLTTQVTWLSSAPATATVSSNGRVVGASHGTTTISATLAGITGSTVVTVQAPVSIEIAPAAATLNKGASQQFSATGVYAGGSRQDLTAQAAWTSSAPTVAAVDASGRVSALDFGSATITATVDGVSGSTPVSVFQPTPSPAPPLARSVAYQGDYAHSGRVVFGTPLTFPAAAAWSVTLPGAVSYPIVAGGKVFVLNVGPSSSGTQLLALDAATGQTAWGPVAVGGTYPWAGHAYDQGRLFVVNTDGLLRSFDAASGLPGWTVQLPGQSMFTSPPTAVNGIVYVGGSGTGGTMYAVNAANGGLLWKLDIASGDHSAPALTADGLYVSYACDVYALDPLSGATRWQFNRGCTGGGGRTVAISGARAYAREPGASGRIFDTASGALLGSFGSGPIPAFGAQYGYFLAGSTLSAIDPATQLPRWAFGGDGLLVSAPFVVDDCVFVGSSTGTVFAVDAATGAQVWSASAGAPVPAPDEHNVSQPLTGFGAGEGLLVVPAGNVLTAWRISGP